MIAPRLTRIHPVTAGLAASGVGVAGWLAAVSLVTSVGYPFFAVVAGVVLLQGALLVGVYRRVGRADELKPFTVATGITVFRGGAIAVLAGFVVASPESHAAWVPAALYAAVAGLDAVDGAVARGTGTVTETGTRLDTETDALGLLVGAMAAIRLGMAPAAYLLVGLARYAFVAGVGWRRWRGKTVRPLPPSHLRRINAGVGMAVVIVLLAPLPGPTVSRMLALVAMVPFLAVFLRDWLLVTGRLEGPCR